MRVTGFVARNQFRSSLAYQNCFFLKVNPLLKILVNYYNPARGLTAIWVVFTLLFLETGGGGEGLFCFFSSFISWNEKKMLSLWPERDIDIYNHPKYNII